MNINNEKRKWQIALRRYVIEKAPSVNYAKYFGVDIEFIRKWIELQFKDGVGWDDFGVKWQFGHVLPLAYFNFEVDEELMMCWNFINIKVEFLIDGANKIESLSFAKTYFEAISHTSNNWVCNKILEKIKKIETNSIPNTSLFVSFIEKNTDYLKKLESFNANELVRLNSGVNIETILAERELLKRFN